MGWAALSGNPTGLLGMGLQPWEDEESNHHFPDIGRQPRQKGRVYNRREILPPG